MNNKLLLFKKHIEILNKYIDEKNISKMIILYTLDNISDIIKKNVKHSIEKVNTPGYSDKSIIKVGNKVYNYCYHLITNYYFTDNFINFNYSLNCNIIIYPSNILTDNERINFIVPGNFPLSTNNDNIRMVYNIYDHI